MLYIMFSCMVCLGLSMICMWIVMIGFSIELLVLERLVLVVSVCGVCGVLLCFRKCVWLVLQEIVIIFVLCIVIRWNIYGGILLCECGWWVYSMVCLVVRILFCMKRLLKVGWVLLDVVGVSIILVQVVIFIVCG